METKNWLLRRRKLPRRPSLIGLETRTDDMSKVKSFSELFSERHEEFVDELRKKYMYEINKPTLRHLIQKDLNDFEKRTGICLELDCPSLQFGKLNFIVKTGLNLETTFSPRQGISTRYGLCDGKPLKRKYAKLLLK